MIPQDQMSRLLSHRYFSKIIKKKKVASYLLEQSQQEVSLLLDEAIEIKRDAKKMEDTYKPKKVQKHWNQFWDKNKFFHADNQTTNPKKFVIALPPPNVTGYLHIGHALTVAIQDSLVRWKRMSGFQTLYVPGTDHAGIATQSVVQKMIMKTENKTRHDFTREEFLGKIWEWKELHGNAILRQLRRTGSSMDWDRLVFTMDQNLSKSVREAFVRLFERGLIYRANRLVNWSSVLRTAISDVQVVYQQLQGRQLFEVPGYKEKIEFGVIIYFAYKLKDDPNRQIIVATTRIETMLGDTAVAVHPQDQRYKDLVGKQLVHPFIPDRKMFIIADSFVEKDFGSGAVKITPAHDPNDYTCGERHKLEFINILTDQGLINENGGKFKGMKRFACRKIIQEQLKKLGLWRQKKNNKMRLAFCQRSKDVIQPIIRPQWWVRCGQISKTMLQVVKTKQLEILPQQYQHTWNRWIGDLRDWCISRQLWWGHRIPAYLVSKKGQSVDNSKQQHWIAARSYQEALQKAEKKLNLPASQIDIRQDQDVLDTWFSSGLFPFSILKWPDVQHPDFKQFFPNSILETGHDILFFWVARMVMMSLWLTDKLPFKTVFLHPIVCDSEGNKMSKSRGNVIDPLQVIEGTSLENLILKIKSGNLPKGEQQVSLKKIQHQFPTGIPQCGSDALRFGLLAYMVQSRSINLNISRIISYRQFCNKIWNTFKFGYIRFGLIQQYDQRRYNPIKCNFLNSWILAKLNKAIKGIINSFEKYAFGQATNYFYNFWYYELCDVYLEATKAVFAGNIEADKQQTSHTLFQCIETGLRLLHPMMPFLTEELYQKLPQFKQKRQSISIHSYPIALEQIYGDKNLSQYFNQIEKQFDSITEVAAAIRSVASSVNLPPHIRPQTYLITEDPVLIREKVLLATLAKASEIIVITDQKNIPKGCGTSTISTTRVFVALKQFIDFEKQIKRLEKDLNEQKKYIENLEKKIQTEDKTKVPKEVQLKNEETLKAYKKKFDLIKSSIDRINELK